jgi:predicted amidohydrolase YtcJ
MAIRNGRIVRIGNRHELSSLFSTDSTIEFGTSIVYPGFMDPHCHFLSYGYLLQRAGLFDLPSWHDVVARLVAYGREKKIVPGDWVQGRGWDQNLWHSPQFPDNTLLNKAFPLNPVLAIRVDGHAGIANDQALSLAGIDASTKVKGGAIAIDQGRPTGFLIDNAVDKVREIIPKPDSATTKSALLSAQSKCFEFGLTSVSNASTEADEASLISSLIQEGDLRIGMYVMLSPTESNISEFASQGPIHSDRLSIRSFKLFADGALGSRGAYLLEPYADDPSTRGLLTLTPEELYAVATIAQRYGYQMNVHSIGDASMRLILDVYSQFLKPGNDLRWRIEHAQLVHPEDLHRFGAMGVIPSIQSSHATSDMSWTERRIGPSRMKLSHAYRSLLLENGWLPNGSDFPIEKIDPLRGFRSAVFRKNDNRLPVGGFAMHEALARQDALRAMTIWAARANFEEAGRGSLEVGKQADFTVLDTDLVLDDEEQIWKAKVVATAVQGTLLYSNDI